MSRGNRRGAIFKEKTDYIEFLEQKLLIQKDMKEDDMWLPWEK